MSLETDLLLDRRRLKRRLFLWRAVAVLAVLGAILLATGDDPQAVLGRDHVARLAVTGTITDDRKTHEALDRLARDPSARALIVFIESPGGTMAGGEGLHNAIARVAAAKPVVAVMGGTAASAGYMAALPAERILARNSTLTGSIGVKLMLPEFSGLLDMLGIGDNSLASAPLKDEPSLARPLSPEGRAVMQALVDDMHEQFVAMVAASRRMEPARVRQLADGRAYTGRQALELGLVDAIGGEREARAWLAAEKRIPTTLPVRDLARRSWTERALPETMIADLIQAIVKTVLSQRLDGAWTIWQPAPEAQ